MFDMFRNMGQMASLLGRLPKIQEEMSKYQQRLGQISAEGDAGAGMVKVKVNGRFEMLACTLSEEALKFQDREMLEDLIKAATNQAVEKVRQAAAEAAQNMASELGIPPGMLPGSDQGGDQSAGREGSAGGGRGGPEHGPGAGNPAGHVTGVKGDRRGR
jgi:DNA-binding YbaB/EbfC family protein